MTTDTTTVTLRPCCRDARERHGAAAPMFGDAIGHLCADDAKVEPVVVETRRSVSVARHECGHAIVALALGGAVSEVTVDGQPRASCRLPDTAPWRHRVAVDLAGDGASWGALPDSELAWHVAAVRNVGGGYCDRCNAARRIVVGLRHPPDTEVSAEYRRVEAMLADFFARPDVRAVVSDLAWTLGDVGTITGDEIIERFGPQVQALNLEM